MTGRAAKRGILTEIGSGVTAWVNDGCDWGASNAALISGHRTSMLVDTMWDLPHTAAMLESLAPRIQAAPIGQLVNTHSDGDHWFGNSLVGAHKRVATRRAAQSMAKRGPREMRTFRRAIQLCRTLGGIPFGSFPAWRLAADYFEGMIGSYNFAVKNPALPNFVFSGAIKLQVGGRDVDLADLGPAHTGGDLAVLLREDRLLLAGDLVFSGVLPVLWDGSVRNWLRACDWMLAQPVDVVLPGHGPVGDLEAVEDIRRYWEFLGRAARYQYEKGREPATAARWIVIDSQYLKQRFSRWAGQERMVINLHSIYGKLMKRRIGPWGRLTALKEAALFADELARAGGIENLRIH
jgi:cyclase